MLISLRLAFLFFISLSDFEGQVVSVIDGDTIEVLKDGKGVRIRLNGIDCPERSQAYGTKAKQFVSDLIYRKQVKVKVKELDRYGRTIADVYLLDGTWLNKRLINAGLAWHYKQYSADKELASSEVNAKQQKLGLWRDPHPIAPWDFRRIKRSN
jgi:micrococcal nuclease